MNNTEPLIIEPITPLDLAHLVPPSVDLPSPDDMDQQVEKRVQQRPDMATPYRQAGSDFRQHVQPLNERYEATREGALHQLNTKEAARTVAHNAAAAEVMRLDGVVKGLASEVHQLGSEVNDHAADAGLSLRPADRTPEGLRNAVRVALGGSPIKSNDEVGPNPVERARQQRDGAQRELDQARELARQRADAQRKEAEARSDAEAALLREEAEAQEEAENRLNADVKAAEAAARDSVAQARKGMPIWLIGLVEWTLTIILGIIPGVIFGIAVGGSIFDINEERFAKINLTRPETFLTGSLATPILMGVSMMILMAVASHFITLLSHRNKGSRMSRVLIGVLVVVAALDVYLETSGFHGRHLARVAEANALSHTMNERPWITFLPWGMIFGLPFLLTKVALCLYKENEVERKQKIVQAAKDEAKANAEEAIRLRKQEIEAQRGLRQQAAEAEAERARKLAEQEATAQRQLAEACEAAEAQLRATEATEAANRQAFEQRVTDFIRNDPNAILANKKIGVLVEKKEECENRTKELAEAWAKYRPTTTPSSLDPQTFELLVRERQAVIEAYHQVNVLLGLAQAKPSPTPPTVAATPLTPQVSVVPAAAAPLSPVPPAVDVDDVEIDFTPDSSTPATASPAVAKWLGSDSSNDGKGPSPQELVHPPVAGIPDGP